LTAQEIREQRDLQQGLCWYCKAKLDNKGNGTIDHKLALSKGGTNCKENIVIACMRCNLKKQVSNYATFRAKRR
jgi:5-methylcytosine-specific restriction endonuclease McrA